MNMGTLGAPVEITKGNIGEWMRLANEAMNQANIPTKNRWVRYVDENGIIREMIWNSHTMSPHEDLSQRNPDYRAYMRRAKRSLERSRRNSGVSVNA